MSIDYDYDSAAVRRAARKINSCAKTVKNDAAPKLKNVRGEVNSEFEGVAADALEDRLSDLYADVNAIAGGLTELSDALYDYAEALEETARRLKEEMSD